MDKEHDILKKIIEDLQEVAAVSNEQLALSQSAAAREDVSPEFIVLIKQRDGLQEEIEKLVATLPGQRENPGLKNDHLAGEKIYELAAAIEKNDQQIRLNMEKFLSGVDNKLKNLRKSKQALKAYSPSGQTNPWFFDGKR